MWRGSPAWTYLTEVRRLPSVVVMAAIRREQVKEGPHASAWFAHRDHEGRLTGIEIRGPDYRGFSPGGDKTLFRLPGAPIGSRLPVTRLAVTEAPIDAMSLAAIEQLRADTLYVSTAGGMGPHTLEALDQSCRLIAGHPVRWSVAASTPTCRATATPGFLREMAARRREVRAADAAGGGRTGTMC